MKQVFRVTLFVFAMLVISAISSFAGAQGEAAAATEAAPISLRFAHTNGDGDLTNEAVEMFADLVEEYTGGRYHVDIFGAGVLGNDTKLLELEAMGAVDFVLCGSAIYAKHLPEMSLLLSPFLVETPEQGQALYRESETVQGWFTQLEDSGFKILSTWERGFRCLNTVRPIESPDEVAGLKLRLPPNAIHLTIWETLGATPVSMGVNEVYMAIQQGLVEGQENPPSTTYGLKFHEVAPYVTLTNHVYGPITVSCSMGTWQNLPADVQDAVMRAADEAGAENNRLMAQSLDSILASIEAEGGTIIRPNISEWYEAVQPAYEAFKADYGAAAVDNLRSEAEAIKAAYPAE